MKLTIENQGSNIEFNVGDLVRIRGVIGTIIYIDEEFAEVEIEGLEDYERLNYSSLELYQKKPVEEVNDFQVNKAMERKGTPIYSGVLRYFPDALRAVAQCSVQGQKQHNSGKPLFWDRSKSGDELDALTRHLIDAGTIDDDGVRHSTKVAWRALANLQKELERDGGV